MIALLIFLLRLLVLPSKPKRGLEAENAALRRQLAILQRKVRSRVRLTNSDRLFFVLLYRWFPSILKTMTIIQPETLVRWHRAGFRRYWRWKSGNLGGRPPISGELRALIRRMNLENALWGAPHIHGELLKLGFVVAQSTVAKYMAKKGGDPPSGQSWSAFLSQSYAAHRCHRFVRRSNHWLSFTLRPRHCSAGSARAGVDQCDSASDGRMDRAADHRSVSLGRVHRAT